MQKMFLFLSVFFSTCAHAEFLININSGYHANSDGNTKYTFNDLTNHAFIGASLGSKDQLFLGQNITKLSTSYKTATTTEISTLEVGPRITYYFNDTKTILFTLAWNPYAKGTRTTLAGVNQDISGSSFLTGLGYEIKLANKFFLGASLMYHSLSVSKAEANNVSTEVSESYTSITPMISMCFRFR